MKGSIWVAVIALATLVVPASAAKDPPLVPDGAWRMQQTRATYSGPPYPVRNALTKLIQNRLVFSPACTQSVCASYVTVRNMRAKPVKFVLTEKLGSFAGSVVMATGLRCNGKALKARLTMTVTVVQRRDENLLSGSTEAKAVNPGGCSLFRGKRQAIRRVWFVGVPLSG